MGVALETGPVVGRELASAGQECVEPRELRAAECRTDVGEPVVVAELHHGVGPVRPGRELRRDPVVAEAPQPIREVVAIGQDGTTFARGQDLRRVEAQDRHVGERADGPPAASRAQRMGGIGDDRERAGGGRVGHGPEGGVVGRLAGVVDRQERTRPRGDRIRHPGRVDQQRARFDVREPRIGPRVEHGVRGGDEGQGRRDRLVPRPSARPRSWIRAAPPSRTRTRSRAELPSPRPARASNAGTRGPVVSQSERSASATAATSSSEIC